MQELFPGLDHGASTATAAWSDREVETYCVLHRADSAWRGGCTCPGLSTAA